MEATTGRLERERQKKSLVSSDGVKSSKYRDAWTVSLFATLDTISWQRRPRPHPRRGQERQDRAGPATVLSSQSSNSSNSNDNIWTEADIRGGDDSRSTDDDDSD